MHLPIQTAQRICALAAFTFFVVGYSASEAYAQDPPDLQPGDQLVIVIPEASETDALSVTIDEFGEVALGAYGRVELAGLSEENALRALQRHLRDYLRSTANVRLTVQLRGILVFVTGMVENPGRYSVPRGSDVWAAIQAAGGHLEGADLSDVEVQFGGEPAEHLDVASRLVRRNTEPLPELRSGQLIFVAAEASAGVGSGANRVLDDASLADKIFVLGAVNGPGLFDRTDGMTPLAALGLANGPVDAAELSNARLMTPSGTFRVDLAAMLLGEDTELVEIPAEGGAILYIPFEAEGSANPFTDGINVIGDFNAPRHLEVRGPLPLFEVIALAGGPGAEANLRRAYHVRQEDRSTIALHYNLRRFLRHGGGLARAQVHPGDTLYLRPDPDNAWESFVGGLSDVAVIGTAVLLFTTLNDQLSGGGS
ncbi:MAG: protein involved in polysaccharide export with SLBB domain [Bradymonadia bacterium]|jgi:protein involved in polysaccharide export with SLBB domain